MFKTRTEKNVFAPGFFNRQVLRGLKRDDSELQNKISPVMLVSLLAKALRTEGTSSATTNAQRRKKRLCKSIVHEKQWGSATSWGSEEVRRHFQMQTSMKAPTRHPVLGHQPSGSLGMEERVVS